VVVCPEHKVVTPFILIGKFIFDGTLIVVEYEQPVEVFVTVTVNVPP
jgi:hypothetical protein